MSAEEIMIAILIFACVIMGGMSMALKRNEEKLENEIRLSDSCIDGDFEKTLKVLESCTSRTQLEAADRMIQSFMKKHGINETKCRDLHLKLMDTLSRKYTQIS